MRNPSKFLCVDGFLNPHGFLSSPHHSHNFQSTSLHTSLASQSTNLHPTLASSSASNLPQASDLPSLQSTNFQTEVVASGSAPRKRGRPRKHVDPCQGGHTFTLLDVDIVSVISGAPVVSECFQQIETAIYKNNAEKMQNCKGS